MSKSQRAKRPKSHASKAASSVALIRYEDAPAARAIIDQGGRILIPAEFRRALGLAAGDSVELRMDAHGLRIRSLDGVVREAQERAVRWVSKGKSIVQDLIEERRREADDE